METAVASGCSTFTSVGSDLVRFLAEVWGAVLGGTGLVYDHNTEYAQRTEAIPSPSVIFLVFHGGTIFVFLFEISRKFLP